MPSNSNKDKSKSIPETKKTPKDLPVRKADADKVKGGAGSQGSEVLR